MNSDEINDKILDLWEEHFKNNKNVMAPFLFNRIKDGCILFIGLNPSLNKYWFNKIVKETELEKKSFKEFFEWKGKKRFDKIKILKFEELAKENYNLYFGERFKEISDLTRLYGFYIEPIDLFFYRATNQKDFKKKIYKDEKNQILNKEFELQLKIAFEIIESSNPKMIIVANAEASRILKKYVKNIDKLNDKIGTYLLNINNKKIPIFFSSMLTGGHLDNGSYERLKWHIKRCLETK